ncbi:S1 RNA-binding domain-containing protein [Thermosyntropha sp.]|uniref:S1 RNA-binding domain-containing protein n=1 Tax=Thermosyntropha sp. TaxID=2740820 RepID=UPI0025F3EC3D|nr:S1 RNA-binding domain-containing protein [Thermosyntropha sp.]MBO8158212.1 S1 RNA-binding domain-containing protein [Thermosyntropha sp.]
MLEEPVTNIVDFGVFVDMEVKKSGLVHISELSHNYVRHPLEMVSVRNKVEA